MRSYVPEVAQALSFSRRTSKQMKSSKRRLYTQPIELTWGQYVIETSRCNIRVGLLRFSSGCILACTITDERFPVGKLLLPAGGSMDGRSGPVTTSRRTSTRQQQIHAVEAQQSEWVEKVRRRLVGGDNVNLNAYQKTSARAACK